MSRVEDAHTAAIWSQFDVYRERYQIDTDLLSDVESLERSISRRRARQAALGRRLHHLEEEIESARAEVEAVADEIHGSRSLGALLISEILDRVRLDHGEGWSPSPVRAFRVWRLHGNAILGNRVPWHGPVMDGTCLRSIPGEDIPHSISRCGPPACGIYAVKTLDEFPEEIASGRIKDSVIGVVSMTGKVIEHELGYRAKRARAIAIAANHQGRRVVTDHPGDIESIFRDPEEAIERLLPVADSSREEARAFLESVQKEVPEWT